MPLLVTFENAIFKTRLTNTTLIELGKFIKLTNSNDIVIVVKTI